MEAEGYVLAIEPHEAFVHRGNRPREFLTGANHEAVALPPAGQPVLAPPATVARTGRR